MAKEKNFTIRFVGLKKTLIKPEELQRLFEIADRETKKVYREIKNNFNLIIDVKEHKQTGEDKRRKYSITLKLKAPGQVITSGRSHKETWKAKDALHKAFENILNKIRTAYHGDSTWRKDYD